MILPLHHCHHRYSNERVESNRETLRIRKIFTVALASLVICVRNLLSLQTNLFIVEKIITFSCKIMYCLTQKEYLLILVILFRIFIARDRMHPC